MKNLLAILLHTEGEFAPFLLRISLAAVILPHGIQKTIGWFGGHGFQGTVGFFTGTMGLPYIIAVLVITAESLGALALIFGFFTRFVAASLALVMLGAIATVHWQNGFFMNWSGQQPGEGFEYHLLVIGMVLSLAITGAGKWSIDSSLSGKIK